MFKKLVSLFLIISFALCASACGSLNGSESDTEAPGSSEQESLSKTPVLGKDGTEIGWIDSRAYSTAVNGGIFYSIFAPEEYHYTADAEYHYFDMETGRDILLGKLEGQGYEAGYTRTELDGKIYTLAVTGNVMSDTAVTLYLLVSDPVSGTMNKITVSTNGFPYAFMAVSDGKLLVMNHEMTEPKCDKIYEYDPVDGTVREVLSFPSNTDSLRGISSAEDGFFVLRLKLNAGKENELFLDRYSNEFVRISEKSLNETLVNAILKIHGITGRNDALNELGMNVADFTVLKDRYLIYENFGLVRLLVDLQTNEELFVKDDIYSVSVGSGGIVFYKMAFEEDGTDPDISVFREGKLVNFDFKPKDSHKLIKEISTSYTGLWLVLTSDAKPAQDRTYVIQLLTE